jgi:lysophospholipid acyltransferase (LPLAT)-like uncharacterized protein
MLPYHFRPRGGPMVSPSRDGDIIADTIERRLCPVRGFADAGRARRHDQGPDASGAPGDIVDGPKGPALVAKAGTIVLARATGLPIVPGTWWAKPFRRVGSWDRTFVPLPFSRIVFAFSPPIVVAADTTDDEVEAYRQQLTRRLLDARKAAQDALGVVEA